MIFGSVCSGIEAASAAWEPLGWRASFFSEISAFPCAVLSARYSSVPNLGDMNAYRSWPLSTLDVLIGGTPCQSFSIAGLRAGLADPRGNLALTFIAIVDRYRPRRVVWENVPGVLSSGGGRDFAAFLGALGQLGYGWAYRVLDAQYFGVPQRRRRVFVVGSLGGWADAAAVLFEPSSLRGDPAPRREAGKGVAPTLGDCSNGGGANGPGRTADTADSLILAHALGASGHDASGHDASEDGTGRGTPLVPVISNAISSRDRKGQCSNLAQGAPLIVTPFDTTQMTSRSNRSNPQPGSPSHPLAASAASPTIAFHARQDPDSGPVTHPLDTDGGSIGIGTSVRRLTPRECERLQGFPDDYTLVPYRKKPAADGPRYEALGNSMAVPVIRWLGQRMELIDRLQKDLKP